MDGPFLETVARTHKGLVRGVNQDAVAVFEKQGLIMLADGMGGHSAGEVASQLAVQTISHILVPLLEQLDNRDKAELGWLQEAIAAANEAVLIAIEEHPQWKTMGTTLVLGLFRHGHMLYAHVGDSRLYRLRNGRLQQLTRDHSLIQSMVDEGVFDNLAEARAAGIPGNMLTRGVGAKNEVEVDAAAVLLEPDDIFLFCSDGLSNMINRRDMESIIHDAQGDLVASADWLMELALANGGNDNVSLVLARPGSASLRHDQ